MIAWGNTTDRILLLLQEGAMTKSEICRRLDLTHDQVASRLSDLKCKSKRFPKRIHISGYTRNAMSGRAYIRPIYSLGNLPDKVCKLKPFTLKERSARSYAKNASLKNASVFTQSLSTRKMIKIKRHIRVSP
jgi:hypothetical protein